MLLAARARALRREEDPGALPAASRDEVTGCGGLIHLHRARGRVLTHRGGTASAQGLPRCVALPESAEAVACAPRRISGWRQLVSLVCHRCTGRQARARVRALRIATAHAACACAGAHQGVHRACATTGPCARAHAPFRAREGCVPAGGRFRQHPLLRRMQRRAAETAPTWLVAAAKGSGAELAAALRPERSSHRPLTVTPFRARDGCAQRA